MTPSYPIQLHNSLTNKVEPFIPINEKHILMYVCGPTVYDHIHIGNARPIVVFDVLYRLLQRHYDNVNYVRNITDIDDKIINRARQDGVEVSAITDKFNHQFHTDIAQLSALPPTVEPRATEHLATMFAMIAALIEQNFAYESQGHVLFSVNQAVQKNKGYGNLSGRKLEDMQAGARIEVADYKRSDWDFVLWKPSTADQPGWQSPWGFGRPGWHIECSAMAKQYLGNQIDIHGGGTDLLFPHHENERIQSCCANNTDEFANYWLHNGYIMMDGHKMSKSLGNLFKLSDLLKEYNGEILRWALLSAHYRKPLEWTKQTMELAKQQLNRIYDTLRRHDHQPSSNTAIENPEVLAIIQQIDTALSDDINTPLALSYSSKLLSGINKLSPNDSQIQQWLLGITHFGERLGLINSTWQQWFSAKQPLAIDVEALIEERNQARQSKNYQRADEIRELFKQHRVIVEDTVDGTTWYIKDTSIYS